MHLDTERLYLRPMTLHDVDDLVALHADPDVSRYMRAFDREEAVQRLRRDDADWREYGHGLFAMLANDGTGFLGRVALKSSTRSAARRSRSPVAPGDHDMDGGGQSD